MLRPSTPAETSLTYVREMQERVARTVAGLDEMLRRADRSSLRVVPLKLLILLVSRVGLEPAVLAGTMSKCGKWQSKVQRARVG
jgi:hypothetical protein